MAPGKRQKKGSIMANVATGIGMVLVFTIGLPVVVIGGSVQLLGTGVSRLFCSNDRYVSNGKTHQFQGIRRGVRIFPA